MDLTQIRLQAEKFSEEMSKEYYLNGAGLKTDINLRNIYANYPNLYTEANLNHIKHLYSTENNSDSCRKLKYLLEAFYGEILGKINSKLFSEYIYLESTGKICISGHAELPFRSARSNIMQERNRVKREEIADLISKFINVNLNPLLEKINDKENEYISESGFKNKADMFINLSGIDLYRLNDEMQTFIRDTDDIYLSFLKKYSKSKLNLELNELKRHDLWFMFKSLNSDSLFPKDKMSEKIFSFLEKMGIDGESNKNIIMDIESRESKSRRAFCSPVQIPREIYLVFYPLGGQDDYIAFLHELGHALHYANAASELDFEYKWYGDSSVTEGYAMTLDHLSMNEKFMDRMLGVNMNSQTDYFVNRFINELVMLRQNAAKLDYEIRLNESDSLICKKELYKTVMESVMKVSYPEEHYLTDIDSYFYCARYLRGWMFQSNIHTYMNENFGEFWFENPEAGYFFKELWSKGQKYNADEMLEMYDCGNLSIKPVYNSIIEILNNKF